MDHLSRVVSWSILQEPLQRLETKLVAAVKAIAELSDADMQAPQRALLHLPHCHGGFGIQRFEEDVADSSFLAAATLAGNAMTRGQQFRPFANAGAAALRATWERVRVWYPEVCPPGLPPDVLVQSFLPQAHRAIRRTPHQRAQGEGNQARLRSCACRPASASLTTLRTAPSLQLQPEEYLTSCASVFQCCTMKRTFCSVSAIDV